MTERPPIWLIAVAVLGGFVFGSVVVRLIDTDSTVVGLGLIVVIGWVASVLTALCWRVWNRG